MGKSGNRAKRQEQHSIAEVRAAVRQGKAMRLRLFPNTTVAMTSKNVEEAVEVIKALQPAPEEFEDEQLDAIFHQCEFMPKIIGGEPRYNQRIW